MIRDTTIGAKLWAAVTSPLGFAVRFGVPTIAVALVALSDRNDPDVLAGSALLYAIVMFLAFVPSYLVGGHGRRNARHYTHAKKGTVLYAGYDDTAYAFNGPGVQFNIGYADVTRILVHRGAVVIRTQNTDQPWVIPRALVPDAVIDAMRSRQVG